MILDISLTGQQLKVLDIAAHEASKLNLDILKYNVSLYRFGSSYIVLLEDPNLPVSHRGGSSGLPTLEVEISDDFQVVRANFSR